MSSTDEDWDIDCTPATPVDGPKPMDPERLAMVRRLHEERSLLAGDMVDELLADRDHHEAESIRLADRLDGHDGVETLSPEQWRAIVYGKGSAIDRLVTFDRAYVTHYGIASMIRAAACEAIDLRAENVELRKSISLARETLEALDLRLVERQTERDEARAEAAALEAMIIAQQDRELQAGPPSERDLRLLHATREVARLRARVRVEADDVKRVGVTWRHVEAWLRKACWVESEQVHGRTYRPKPFAWAKVLVGNIGGPAQAVETIARHHERPGLDILDEMAALEVPS